MIINITGQAGSGKTTISKELALILKKPIIIDGDKLRSIFNNTDYSRVGRRKNIENAYTIAKFLEESGFTPIIALISPYLDLREDLKSHTKVTEIYLATTQIRGKEKFFAPDYEVPQDNFLPVNTDLPLDDCVYNILVHIFDKK